MVFGTWMKGKNPNRSPRRHNHSTRFHSNLGISLSLSMLLSSTTAAAVATMSTTSNFIIAALLMWDVLCLVETLPPPSPSLAVVSFPISTNRTHEHVKTVILNGEKRRRNIFFWLFLLLSIVFTYFLFFSLSFAFSFCVLSFWLRITI